MTTLSHPSTSAGCVRCICFLAMTTLLSAATTPERSAILLNYKGTFKDVSTLAHELGHAMQSWFAKEHQPPVYAGYPMFTAEVASTAAEIVFKRSILNRTQDPKERAFLLNQMLEDMRGAIFRQTQFAEFDLAAHTLAEKGEPMTAESLMNMYHDSYTRYYGPDFVIDPGLDVDMTTPKPIEDAMALFEQLLQELDQLLE